MTDQEINEANKKSAQEQVEQDKRNEELKGESKADALFNRPRKPLMEHEDSPKEARDKELRSVVEENIKASDETHNN